MQVAQLTRHHEIEFDDLELKVEVAAQLQTAEEAVAHGEAGIPHEEIFREFGL